MREYSILFFSVSMFVETVKYWGQRSDYRNMTFDLLGHNTVKLVL